MGICRLCRSNESTPVIDLGLIPIAHQFSDTQTESLARKKYPMSLEVCPQCGMAQLEETIPPDILYSDYNYCFSTWKKQPHITDECEMIGKMMPSGTVVEVGCNDGLFLSQISQFGDYHCIGIEPNKVSSQLARERGFTVVNKFFEDTLEAELKDVEVNVVVARQVLEHIHDVDLFLKEANRMLTLGGLICIEVPNTDIALRTGDVSCLWEEHVNYFTPASLRAALQGFGFSVKVSKTYHFSGEAILMIAEKVTNCTEFEKPKSVNIDDYLGYAKAVSDYKTKLLKTVNEFKQDGYQIVLYGSGCRASVALHSLELNGLVDTIVDDQVEKQGKFMPKAPIPVSSSSELNGKENLLVLLAVNNENESTVIDKVNQLNIVSFQTISLHSPNDISSELDKINSLLSHAT